jgi:hypothetical protein
MIFNTGSVAVSRRVIRHVRSKRRPSARCRTNFFLQNAPATIIPAWKIYHGASDPIGH